MNKIPIRKKWGQNFLIDQNIIKKIIKTLNPKKINHIIEIGPGQGALTKPLSSMGLKVTAIEIDPMLCTFLNSLNLKNVEIINQDILKYDSNQLPENCMIIGNLPYNISTPILFKFMGELNWIKMVVMLQKEVAERIVSRPNNKKYGKISIMMQSFFDMKLEFNIPRTVFNPKPKITSSLLSVIPKNNIKIKYQNLKLVVENAFKHRRKKLVHNLKNILQDDILETIKNKRAEEINIQEYQMLSQYIK